MSSIEKEKDLLHMSNYSHHYNYNPIVSDLWETLQFIFGYMVIEEKEEFHLFVEFEVDGKYREAILKKLPYVKVWPPQENGKTMVWGKKIFKSKSWVQREYRKIMKFLIPIRDDIKI